MKNHLEPVVNCVFAVCSVKVMAAFSKRRVIMVMYYQELLWLELTAEAKYFHTDLSGGSRDAVRFV